MSEDKTIYNLKLHEAFEIQRNDCFNMDATRVPGGWIYTQCMTWNGTTMLTSVFVPWIEEILPNECIKKTY